MSELLHQEDREMRESGASKKHLLTTPITTSSIASSAMATNPKFGSRQEVVEFTQTTVTIVGMLGFVQDISDSQGERGNVAQPG